MRLTRYGTRRRAGALWRLPRIATVRTRSALLCVITAWGFRRQLVGTFSNDSLPRRTRAWEWASPLCARSSRHMAEQFGLKMPRAAERVFIFVCQLLRRRHND